jgi:polysaccharide biosynthesis transport protein
MHAPLQAVNVENHPSEVGRKPSEQRVGLRDVVSFLRSSRYTIALTVAICGAAAVLYLVLATPIFTSSSQVLIDSSKVQLIVQDGQRSDTSTDQARVESQIAVLKSGRVALAVIRKLNLVAEPEFAEPGLSLSGLVYSWLESWLGPDNQGGDESQEVRLVEEFSDRTSVRRIGQSLVIEIVFQSADPQLAAKVANAIALEYIAQNVESKSEVAQQRSKWLAERLAELQRQSFDAARAVEHFKHAGGSGPTADAQAKLAELESVSQGYRRMYEAFLQQLTETVQRVSFPESDARIVSDAAPPLRKSYPKRGLILGFAILLGIGAGDLVDAQCSGPSNSQCGTTGQ